jgi:hypothetical protein
VESVTNGCNYGPENWRLGLHSEAMLVDHVMEPAKGYIHQTVL